MNAASDELSIARKNLDAARAEFVRAVARASAAGMSLRQIAAVSGISHESVRRILRDASN